MGPPPEAGSRGKGTVLDLPTRPAPGELRTDRDEAYLRWRYGFGPLHYRVWTTPTGTDAVVFRVRRRGAARELAVLEALGAKPASVGRLLREVGADYAVGLGISRPAGGVPLPKQGPLLTWKGLGVRDMPPLPLWGLALGDVELF